MTQEINKAFHEAAGKCWHKDDWVDGCAFVCVKCGTELEVGWNPDYCADPRLVIKVMREREDWDEFADTYFIPAITGDGKRMFYISEHLITDKTGKLAKLATEWINKQKGKSDG